MGALRVPPYYLTYVLVKFIFINVEDVETTCNLTLPSKKRRIEDIANLPETCTVLRTKNGGWVYVVGTAHFSHESQVNYLFYILKLLVH